MLDLRLEVGLIVKSANVLKDTYIEWAIELEFYSLFQTIVLINYIFSHIFDPLLKKSVLIEQLLWCLVNNLIFGACLLRCHPCVENKFHTCNFPGFSGHPLFSSYNLNRLIHKRRYVFLKLDIYIQKKFLLKIVN